MKIMKSSVASCILAFCFAAAGQSSEITLQPGLYETIQPGYSFVVEGIDSESGQLVFRDVKNSLRSDLFYRPTGNEIHYLKSSTAENVWLEVSGKQLLPQCPVTLLTDTTFKINAKDCYPQNGQDFFYSLVH